MTKELSQSIEILQYSTLDLISFLKEQSLENPLIEIGDFSHSESRMNRKKTTETSAEQNNWIENIEENPVTLRHHLFNQVADLQALSSEKKLISYLIDQIDENGYLSEDVEHIYQKFHCTAVDVEQAITQIQSLDPAGVGARNLKECILLQLQRLPVRHEFAEVIIRDYFELFANKSWKELAKMLHVELSDIQRVQDFIQLIEPKPGAVYQNEKPRYIIPDIIINRNNNEFEMILNEDHFPSLSLNTQYHRLLVSQKDSLLRSYANEKFHHWQWIMKSLEQRKQTLMMVMQEILNVQMDFFMKGPQYLKPLTMKRISDAIEIHESTVSRAVRDKFVQTPFGTFEMRYFFKSSIQTTSNEDTSSEIVKQLIEGLVKKEDKQKPLSDQKIVAQLEKEHEIILSRRTVAKYRDQLGIPSSSKRKRYE